VRAFLAVELSEEVLKGCGRLAGEGKRRFPGLRWVRPENLHLTLRFLGDISEERAGSMREGVLAIARAHDPLSFRVGPPGSFGPWRAPRTLWLGIDAGAEALGTLAGRLESTLGPASGRPFQPHLTVARNPRGEPTAGWEALVAECGLIGLWTTAAHITLYSSLLRPQGPVHAPVWTAAFAAARSSPPRSQENDQPPDREGLTP
jgi:2'-5' RNA ligase